MAVSTDSLDPVFEEQLSRARERQSRDLSGREGRARVAVTGVAVVVAVALPLLTGSDRHPGWWLYLAFAVAYALVSSIQIEVGSGLALPTELVFVPMLFMLPAGRVPLVVLVGLLAAGLLEVARRRLSLERALVKPANALFAVGPALVFVAAGEPRADWRGGLVLLAAVAAQFACDGAAACVQEWLALRLSPRVLLRPLASTFAIDALMAPVAYGLSVAERLQAGAMLLAIPLVALLVLFARERRDRLDSVLELSAAYRGTAFLLGDVVEADDAYTGDHSRQVVELVAQVSERLGLGARELRLAELTALLHDVGKIRVPAAIINKPGSLDPAERAIIETHTIEGERLLERVGGVLAEVGHMVRSSHERWDGCGYPDGLAGEEIPLVSRIVCCCDAYNAMTTNRPYRRALEHEAAIAELLTHSGAQFDPLVVDALIAVRARGVECNERGRDNPASLNATAARR